MLTLNNALDSLSALGPVQQLILQPTNFCNLDCSYCYLPNRTDTRLMTKEIALRALDRLVEAGLVDKNLEIRWHAGEPLTIKRKWMTQLLGLLNERSKLYGVLINHSIQTNGTLIDDEFCQLAKSANLKVGLSFDGPQKFHDKNRTMRDGRGTFSEVIKGVEKLKSSGIEFDVICVLTEESLRHPDEIYSFFCDLGVRQIGFNFEESEGINVSNTHKLNRILELYINFMERVFQLSLSSDIKIREIEEMKKVIVHGSKDIRNISNAPFAQVTIDTIGRLYTYSPELVGIKHHRYGHFFIGNVMQHSLSDMIATSAFRKINDDIENGVLHCRKLCEYYRICGGGSPSNKLGETGTFLSTETWHCKARYKILAEIVLNHMEKAAIS